MGYLACFRLVGALMRYGVMLFISGLRFGVLGWDFGFGRSVRVGRDLFLLDVLSQWT